MQDRLSLKIIKGGQEIGVQHFDREIIKIGRLASAHLKLDDPRVSRIHAVIEVGNGGQDISIIDMGSAEGTFVNGEKVTKIKLREGDEIRLGDTRLVLGIERGHLPAAVDPSTTEVVGQQPDEQDLRALQALPLGGGDGGVFEDYGDGETDAMAPGQAAAMVAQQPVPAQPERYCQGQR